MKRHFWFVAAGTGGHIFPGLSVADEMTKLVGPQASFLFWGDASRLEAKLVPQAGYPIRFLNVEQFKGRSKLKKILALFGAALSTLGVMVESFRRRPVALVSVGGYVSVPVALVAKLRRIPIFLIEPNSISGMANSLVSKWAVEAYVSPALPESSSLKCPRVKTGNPVRADLPTFVVQKNVKKILVLGGSQGAAKVSSAVVSAASALREQNLLWTLQVGEKKLAEMKALVSAQGLESVVEVVAFINDVSAAYASCDVLISRAGATTLAEMAVVGVPSVLIPYPSAADDHQRINARAFASVGAALMVEECAENFEHALVASLNTLLNGEAGFTRRLSLHRNLKTFARPAASQEITKRILDYTSPGASA